jgi:hypothetical protein
MRGYGWDTAGGFAKTEIIYLLSYLSIEGQDELVKQELVSNLIGHPHKALSSPRGEDIYKLVKDKQILKENRLYIDRFLVDEKQIKYLDINVITSNSKEKTANHVKLHFQEYTEIRKLHSILTDEFKESDLHQKAITQMFPTGYRTSEYYTNIAHTIDNCWTSRGLLFQYASIWS